MSKYLRLLALLLVLLIVGGRLAAQVSDDFNSPTLNTSLWTYINPLNDVTQSMAGTGTQDAVLVFSIPAGVSHDIWFNGNIAPRVMQACPNTDFEVEVKFQAPLTQQYQIEGIIVQQDLQNFIRFDFVRDGTNTRIFAGSFVNNTGSNVRDVPIVPGNPLYLRVKREGNQWTESYSYNGTNWTAIAPFERVLTVSSIGPYAANEGNPSSASPAFAAQVDYFFNTASPIVPEDVPSPPNITGNPSNQTVNVGQIATFSVTATGGLPLGYQWQKNNIDIPAATNSSYSTPPVIAGDDGATFRCVVSNAAGTVTSNPALLTVRVPPTIGTNPSPQSVLVGQTATFSVAASGTPPLAYRWQKNNSDIPGATSSSYTTPPTVLGDNGSLFRCIVSNVAGSATSNQALLTVTAAPQPTAVSIIPATSTVQLGIPFSLSVIVNDITNLHAAHVQFTFDNTVLSYSGTTQGAFLSSNGDQTFYASNPAPGPSVTTVIVDQAILGPGTVTGTGTLFTINFTGILNATTTIVIDNIDLRDGLNNSITAGMNNGTVTVGGLLGPNVTGHPTDQTVVVGQTASFSVTATGSAPLSFQWTKNNAPIGGATNSSYTTPATVAGDDGASFRCVVSNAVGTVTSNPAILHLQFPPSFNSHPSPQTVTEGLTASFSVSVSGTAPFGYQWLKNTIPIGGATNSSYTTPPTSLADNGAQFACVVSNAFGTVTSNSALLTVTGLPPAGIVSDDFNSASLNTSLWTYTDPRGDVPMSLIGTGTNDALLVFTIPAGVSHDLWDAGLVAPRVMQHCPNADFEAEVKFQAPLTQAYQIQGIIVQQDLQNFMRFDFVRDASNTRLFAASFVNNSPSALRDVTITPGNPLYLRVKRQGNVWTPSYSLNGTTWNPIASFTHALNVTAIGPYAANHGFPATTSPAFTAQVDYFFNTASPKIPEDGPIGPVGPTITQHPQPVSVVAGQSASFSVTATGTPTLFYQWQKNNADIGGATNASYTTGPTVLGDNGSTYRCIVSNAQGTVTSNPAALTVTAPVPPNITHHPANASVVVGQTASFSVTATGTLPLGYQWLKNSLPIGGATASSYTTPATVLGDNGAQFQCIVSNSVGTVTSNVAILTVHAAPPGIISDDFHTPSLNTSLWTYVNPLNDVTLSFTGSGTTDAVMVFTIPAGVSHDVWSSGNIAPRVMQNIPNGDFEAEVKFQAALTQPYQIQGIIVQQDAQNFMRFDFVRDASNTRLFAASFVNNSPSALRDVTITPGNPLYLRVKRQGNVWTPSYSLNGTTWTPIASFTHALNVTAIGPYAANHGFPASTSPAFTCQVDYFFNTASPLVPEDPTSPVITSQPTGQTVSVGATATFTVGASGANPLGYQWQKNMIDISGATNASYTTPATVSGDDGATFRCVVSNTFGTVTSNPALLHVAIGGAIVSDDFHAATLNGSLWTFVNPLSDVTLSITGAGTADALLNLTIPGGAEHDIYTGGYNAPRIMQNAGNTDFVIQAKFQSTFTGQYTHEGIVVEQDANNVIRFDFYYDGSGTSIFGASMTGGFGSPVIHVNVPVIAGAQNPAYMRITRSGNTWTESWSLNGTTFTDAGSFTLPFTVTKVGVWGGNSGASPAFTLKCDYFFNMSSPIVPEDGFLKQATAAGGERSASRFALGANFPNPFNPTTTLEYEVPAGTHVEIAVFNMLGERVTTLVDGWREAGVYSTMWNGANDAGHLQPSGAYLCRMRAGDFVQMRRMLLIK